MPLEQFDQNQIVAIALIFAWTGFVRTGLGFGGAALGLPLMLFVLDQPLYWLPIIGIHLLFFSGMTLGKRLNQVDWGFLKPALIKILPAMLVGVFGLVSLPNTFLLIFIYSVTLFYGITWLFNYVIKSHRGWLDNLLLITGGYIAGTSLTGAPLIVAVFVQHISKTQLRNTLFVLWFILVTIKMLAFIALGVKIEWLTALTLIPIAAVGHVIGFKMHESIMYNDVLFKKITGLFLIIICLLALYKVFT